MNKIDAFIQHIKSELKTQGLILRTSTKNYFYPNNPKKRYCGSYTPGYGINLAVGGPRYKWLPVLVHEYCHFLQHQENCLVWSSACQKIDKMEYGDILNDWWELIPKKVDFIPKSVIIAHEKDLLLEWDCEKRTYEILKNKNLCSQSRLDVQCQGMCCYAILNQLSQKWKWTGFKWKSRGKNYNCKSVFDTMPKSFSLINPLTPPKQLIKIMETQCIPKSILNS